MDLSTVSGILGDTLAAGLPVLAFQFAIIAAIHAVGIVLYKRVSPFDEDALVAGGNVAAGILLGGSMVALAIPLAATLANNRTAAGILIWGLVALAIQLAVFAVLLRRRSAVVGITQGNVAVAVRMVGTMLAFALLNAGAMLG